MKGKDTMSFQIVHNDIVKKQTDAIVNAANSHLQKGGGVCDAIFHAAGVELLQKECDGIGLCPVGQAVITKGYNLAAKYIIHAVGPVWNGGSQGEDKLLLNAYQSSLKLAKEYHLNSIAFPLISSGIYGYPKEEALQIAISAISEFLLHNEMDIYLVVYDRKAISLSEKLFTEINHYIETYYEDSDEYENRNSKNRAHNQYNQIYADADGAYDKRNINKAKQVNKEHPIEEDICCYMSEAMPRSLDDIIGQIDETFSEMLLRLIDEKGRSDVEVYKKANIDRKLFSKIRSDKDYQPKKRTALALAIALELSLDETKDLLMKAGYTLSNSNRFDLIIRYFIVNESYDMFVINEALFNYEQPLLGA
jgi:O-acetyl-ADP-ribose deacetylase (regulator of RNase III)